MTRVEYDKKLRGLELRLQSPSTWSEAMKAMVVIMDEYIKSLEYENDELRSDNEELWECNEQLSKTLDTKFCFRELAIDPPEV